MRILRAVVLSLCLVSAAACAQDEPEEVAGPVSADDAAVNDARYNCLLDQGLAVTRGEQGEVVFQDPKDTQGSAYTEANRVCDEKLADAGLIQEDSPESLRSEYAGLSELHACLVDAGLPLVDWPSEQVFVESGGAANVLEATSPVSLEDAQQACPDEFRALNGS